MKKRILALSMIGIMLFGACGKDSAPAMETAPAAAMNGGDSYATAEAVAPMAEAKADYAEAALMDMGTAGSMDTTGTQPVTVQNQPQAQSGILTAGVWNDLENWDFFSGLVEDQTISFPAYGIDPVRRVAVTVRDNNQAALENETVILKDVQGQELWEARTDADGRAYLFYGSKEEPATVCVGDDSMEVSDDMEFITTANASLLKGLQVMFIMDTTGSMGDELNYLKRDFQRIVKEVDDGQTEFSVNFYKDDGDDYVTRVNPFTTDTDQIQRRLEAESADGGGDFPEAVAQILDETLVQGKWNNDSAKVAFLIFDAPPHDGTERSIENAVRTAAAKGIHVVPVVSSNAYRDTELFGRALAICTNADYVFLTDDSGVGDSHLEPIIGQYTVETLHDIIVRIIQEYQP